MMKNKSNAGKTRKLGNLFSLMGWGVINYNPCDHWMSPLFLQWGTNSLAAPKPGHLSVQGDGHWGFLQKPNCSCRQRHTWSKAESREGSSRSHTHTHRNTPWMQLPAGSLSVYLVVNNATPREAGWQILRGSQESTAASEEMWRKPGLEHRVPWGRQ